MSHTVQSSSTTTDTVRDIFRWRRKKLSLVLFFMATAIWEVFEVYQFSFITVASWVAMFIGTSLFLWANILRLLGKEPPNLSGLEITEESAMEMVNSIREWIEEGIRWMFRVGAESEWYVFAGVEAGLFLLSLVGSCFDLLTLLYIGVMVGMTVPPIYVKYEGKIKGYEERLRMQCRRFCVIVDEKVFKKINKVVEVKKDEKVE